MSSVAFASSVGKYRSVTASLMGGIEAVSNASAIEVLISAVATAISTDVDKSDVIAGVIAGTVGASAHPVTDVSLLVLGRLNILVRCFRIRSRRATFGHALQKPGAALFTGQVTITPGQSVSL